MTADRFGAMKSSKLFILLLLAQLPFLARGQGYTVDQRNDPENSIIRYWTITYPGALPLGQEFVPTLSGLNTVELLFDALDGTFAVRIHEGTITSSIIAQSATTAKTSESPGILRFDFGEIVPLQAGNKYVLEFVSLSGSASGIGSTVESYSSGAMIRGGQAIADDLWFREGVSVPEPAAGTIALVGLGIGLIMRRRTS